MMEEEDLELQNKNFNTALCLAAAAGSVKMVESMVKKNRSLLNIPGSQDMMPLYMSALLGNLKMVNYLYKNSQTMGGDYWTHQNRGWVLLRCVEANLFALDSNDLLYLKEQMEAEEDAERLLCRTEISAFAAF